MPLTLLCGPGSLDLCGRHWAGSGKPDAGGRDLGSGRLARFTRLAGMLMGRMEAGKLGRLRVRIQLGLE